MLRKALASCAVLVLRSSEFIGYTPPAGRETSGQAAVMRHIGMKQEGHLRQHLWFKGAYHDSYLFSILKDEFEV